MNIVELNQNEVVFVSGGENGAAFVLTDHQIVGVAISGCLMILSAAFHLMGAVQKGRFTEEIKGNISKMGCQGYIDYC